MKKKTTTELILVKTKHQKTMRKIDSVMVLLDNISDNTPNDNLPSLDKLTEELYLLQDKLTKECKEIHNEIMNRDLLAQINL